MLERILEAIFKGTSDLTNLSKAVGVNPQKLTYLLKGLEGISIEEGKIEIRNRLSLILAAIEKGASPSFLSRFLSWREFEEEISRILSENEYMVYTNVVFYNKSRWQIDVVAFSLNKALIIDCKHWKRATVSQLKEIAEKHYERTANFTKSIKLIHLAKKNNFKRGVILPVIITLTSSYKGLMGSTFIVPIRYFQSFLKELDEVIEIVPSKVIFNIDK